MSKVYGESKYTGGKDGHLSNWPGMGGRPPLEIPASQFFFRWQTDGSVSSAVHISLVLEILQLHTVGHAERL